MENKIINTINFLAIDMVNNANSGHPGMPLGCSSLMFILWTKIIRYNPENAMDLNRDRFILSNGHGCALLYTMLHLLGFDYSIEDLKNFRKIESKTPGHPEFNSKLGIETTTGPLGQGIANGVGMAIASKKNNLDNMVFVMCGDGCLMEGISYEACSLAGHLNLNNLILLYDDNSITIDGSTDLSFTEDITLRFKSINWDVFVVLNGNSDYEDIFNKIISAKNSDKPSIVIVKTIIGYGSSLANSSKSHGAPLGIEIAKQMKRDSFFDENKYFQIDDDVKKFFTELREKKLNEFKLLNKVIQEESNICLLDENLINDKETCSTRELSGKVLKEIVLKNKNIIIGSADLSESNKIPFSDKNISKTNYNQPYLHFGVREHAMTAISNGISTYNMVPIIGTFLMFINYCLPAIRLAALSQHKVIYVLTHDSVFLGEDGPTHQPIESLTILRSIPNLITFRPCNFSEIKQSYNFALKNNGPIAVVLSRQSFKIYESKNDISMGAYVIFKEEQKLKYILVSTGSEVPLAIEVAKEMKNIRVISMPSCELFDKQTKIYKDSILPDSVVKISLEAGSTLCWYKYVDLCYGIDTYGKSGNLKDIKDHFSFTKEKLIKYIEKLD